MKRVILGELIRYNANTGNKHVGDCVKRSISIAFRMDYNDAGKELNRIKREHGYPSFNCTSNIIAFLEERGLRFTTITELKPTVEEFANEHPSGTYILLTGNEKKAAQGVSSHMLTIVNGDVYDSWDSLSHLVVRYCKVEDETAPFSNTGVDAIVPDIHDFVEQYIGHIQDKFPYGYIQINEPDFEPVDGVNGIEGYAGTEYGGDSFEFRIFIDWIEGSFEPVKFYNPKYNVHKTFIVKMNPTHDLDTNLANNKKRLKQRIYDWLYEVRKLIDDSEKSRSIETHPRFHGRKRDLMKLPEWSRPLIKEFLPAEREYEFWLIYMDPLPDDPNQDEVRVEGDTLTELKYNLEWYRTDFARSGYDY